ncbi:tyrosine-type recombinase/integrase [Flagellimonas sp.]|uniref:tyrosine-type recombinase/integrase n=1 Tax=Flagellimonas sp. TaxID=2058762 RepID=UPI003BAA0983
MYNTENLSHPTPLVDYIPAELRENKTWEVVFYALDPSTQKLKIKRHRVRKLKSISERRKLGKRMVFEVNNRLAKGWNPFIKKGEENAFTKLKVASKIFVSRIEKQVENGDLRQDTLRSYKSYLKNLLKYCVDIGEPEMFCIKFNQDFIEMFVDHIYYDRDNSARTRNNYLNFLKTFSEWMVKKKFISKNPTEGINPIKENKKKRTIIANSDLKRIFDHLRRKDRGYLVCCMICYYCLIRRTEMTKLKVSDVFIKNSIIHIPAEVSKNKKAKAVTVPSPLIQKLAVHISRSNDSDYLFSNGFEPGPIALDPKKVSDLWAKIRKELNLPTEYQWYSLKDTGITNLLKAGVPLIAVRNQARHHSSDQTDAYTPKDILLANESIKNAKI